MPKVMVDLRMVHGSLHGIARYALELAQRLPALRPEWAFCALVPPSGLPPNLGELHPNLPLYRCRAAFLSPLEQPALLHRLLQVKPDLFHATSFSVPALWKGNLVASLHDANHLAVKESRSPLRTAYYWTLVRPRILKAREILTVSEFSKTELLTHLKLPQHLLRVIPNGVSKAFSPKTPQQLENFKKYHRLPPQYFAVPGNLKPFKNLKVLREASFSSEFPLALLAGEGAKQTLGFAPRTVEVAPLDDEALACFFAAATATLIPSRYEGFGLLALESMACHTPAIISEAPALQEVTGGHAWVAPSDNPQAWEEACRIFAQNKPLREQWAMRAAQQAARFSWHSCAQQTLQCYERALALPHLREMLPPRV